jgi:arylsulfatase A
VSLVPACEGKPPVQAADGSVLLHGRDATVRGTTLRYEPAEKKQTLGFWVKPTDAAEWSFTLDRGGAFDVEVLQGCGPGNGGSPMRVDVDGGGAGGRSLTFVVEETRGFQDFRPRMIGRVMLPAGAHLLRIVPEKIARQAACDIRQVRLVPAAGE